MRKITIPRETRVQQIVGTLCTAKEAKEILCISNSKTFLNRAKKGLFGEYTYVGGYFVTFLRENIMRVKGNPTILPPPQKG